MLIVTVIFIVILEIVCYFLSSSLSDLTLSLSVAFFPLQVLPAASRANGAAKCLPTSTTETATWNTRAVWTTATGSSPVPCATAPSTSETDSGSTFSTCTRNTVLTSVANVASGSPNHPVLTSTCECTAVFALTSALTASRHSPPLLSCARIYVNTAARSHSSVAIVGVPLRRTRRMIVTWGARTPRKSHACARTAEKRLRNRTSWSSTSICTRGKSRTHARNAAVGFRVLHRVTDTDLILIARQERIVHLR